MWYRELGVVGTYWYGKLNGVPELMLDCWIVEFEIEYETNWIIQLAVTVDGVELNFKFQVGRFE